MNTRLYLSGWKRKTYTNHMGSEFEVWYHKPCKSRAWAVEPDRCAKCGKRNEL